MAKDHLGNEFETIAEMCRHHGMKVSVFRDRKKSGWSIEDALTIKPKEPIDYEFKEGAKDHLGNEFPSLKAMCDHYHLSESTYKHRRAKGMSLEERLTFSNDKVVLDHKGNEFKSEAEMYRHWGVDKAVFKTRKHLGWTVQECLEGKWIYDHEGNKFKTESEMIKHWGVAHNAFNWRKKLGWTLEECLTGNHKEERYEDHKGNKFESIKEMCDFYDVNQTTFNYRRGKGFSLEECLEGIKPENAFKTMTGRYEIQDHLGNTFRTTKEMCKHYGISYGVYLRRKQKGMSLKDCLASADKKQWVDHLGNEFESKKDLCDCYGISVSMYDKRQKEGWTIEATLTLDVENNKRFVYDHLGNRFESKKQMCKYHGVDYDSFIGKIQRGVSIEEALKKPKLISDGYGNSFKNEVEMCKYYNISNAKYKSRKKYETISLEECLGLVPVLTWCVKDYRMDEELTVIRMILPKDFPRNTFFECENNGRLTIMRKEEIIDHYRKKHGYIGT